MLAHVRKTSNNTLSMECRVHLTKPRPPDGIPLGRNKPGIRVIDHELFEFSHLDFFKHRSSFCPRLHELAGEDWADGDCRRNEAKWQRNKRMCPRNPGKDGAARALQGRLLTNFLARDREVGI
jgi:hypothetical protein